jgi:hypothetical protein
MAVKFGKEGFSSRVVRKFVDGAPPDDPKRDRTEIDARRMQSTRVLMLLAVIGAVYASSAFLWKVNSMPDGARTTTGRVLVKDEILSSDGPRTYVLGLEVKMPDGSIFSAVVPTDRETWERHAEGDAVSVQYYRDKGADTIAIQRIMELLPPAEF